ncbi:MAG: 1-acyl-sn-glycerol-3-phosphate acyltransferase [Sphingomonas sp.]|nr:lysophospholipid acyltransferase family protein [Sphingomonas sp.]MBX9795544.1 1-acyl-sn-glycerol-3-phosphate acyltransferase [Sphingomonas sp.]
MAWLRTWAFQAIFYGGSVVFVLMSPLAALIDRRVLVALVHQWCRFHRLACALILGIRSRAQGVPPPGQYLYAAKHHAMYETLELVLMLGDPVVVIKQELARIPIWGWAVQRFGAIVVDRDASATALRAMMQQARAAKAAGRSVLIFPEGTRVPEGARPPLKSGFAGLYRAYGLPVVPVAIDSGRNWPRGKPKRAGVVTFAFDAPIAPGAGREAIEAAVHTAINRLEP